jgi:hypothetical protein
MELKLLKNYTNYVRIKPGNWKYKKKRKRNPFKRYYMPIQTYARGHVGFCDGQKWRWGRFSPRTSGSPANIHSICFSTIIFTITRGWHNRPGLAAVPIASQTK